MPDPMPQAALAQARDLLSRGLAADAIRSARQAKSLVPGSAEAWQLEGAAFLSLGRLAEAIPLFEQALKLEPEQPAALFQLGLVLAHQGRFGEAEPRLRKLLRLDEGNAEAWLALGGVLLALENRDEAVECHRTAAGLKPGQSEFHYRLAECLAATGSYEAALPSYEKTLELRPDHPHARQALGMALQQLHRIPEALREYERQLAARPPKPDLLSHRLLALHYVSGIDRKKLFEEHLAYGRLFETPQRAAEKAARRFPNGPAPEKRLRVALLSPDLRIHSVAFFLQPLLANLDRSQFEVLLYHDNPRVDAFTEVLKLGAARWTKTAGLNDARLEALILRDAPDLLIDLCGHTNLNRLPLLARRLAPVQLSYLGYPDTTGLGCMDYRLTDGIADPEGEADPFCSEKLLRFSPCAWCFWPPPGAPEPSAPPALRDGRISFGCFNSFSKLSDATLDLWAELLARVPEARLVLKSIRSSAAGLPERFSARGIRPDRLSILPTASDAISHLATYAEIDIALDPFPYNGTTTTCEALWMGVPVLNLRGDRHSARVGASLLTALGHPEWALETKEAFLEKAVKLSRDPRGLATLRQELRPNMRRSILLDGRGQAERLGEALRSAWRSWCSRARM